MSSRLLALPHFSSCCALVPPEQTVRVWRRTEVEGLRFQSHQLLFFHSAAQPNPRLCHDPTSESWAAPWIQSAAMPTFAQFRPKPRLLHPQTLIDPPATKGWQTAFCWNRVEVQLGPMLLSGRADFFTRPCDLFANYHRCASPGWRVEHTPATAEQLSARSLLEARLRQALLALEHASTTAPHLTMLGQREQRCPV